MGHAQGRFQDSDIDWVFLSDLKKEGTDEQRKFVLKSMNTPDFAILEGPPGSGKTTAISELICQLLERGKRVLLAASTHVAVDNVLEKLEKKFADRGGPQQGGIVPLRIGHEEHVVEELQKYQIDNKRSAMENLLEGELWFSTLEKEAKLSLIDELLARSSNLVCGTTIGILQYPSFRKESPTDLDYVTPEFDYLIIDEASKTTFQEFLVPARHCRRWILVGDVRQLSPFTDTLHVRVNLDGMLQDDAVKKALVVYLKLVFERASGSRRLGREAARQREVPPPAFIYLDRIDVLAALNGLLEARLIEDKSLDSDSRRLEDLRVAFVVPSVSDDPATEGILLLTEEQLRKPDGSSRLLACDLVFADESVYRRNWKSFPVSHVLVDALRPDTIEVHDFRHRHWIKAVGGEPYKYRVRGGYLHEPDEIKDDLVRAIARSWAGELAWRLKRVYELPGAASAQGYYRASRQALLPPWAWEEFRDVHRAVGRMSKIAFPSILTSLQEGLTQDARPDDDRTVMSHGLPRREKEPRHARLSYQHRMHPEISAIPREIFYRGQALLDVGDVRSGSLDWPDTDPFPDRPRRVVWIDAEGQTRRNTNVREVEIVLDQMGRFIRWAREGRNAVAEKVPPWRIIILSFYEAQRRLFRDRLRELDPQQSRKETQFVFDGVEVRNYTVDRVQGQEGDIVFLSMVQTGRVGFMDSPNRLNVAITRARYKLVIVGRRSFFLEQRTSPELAMLAQRASPPVSRSGR